MRFISVAAYWILGAVVCAALVIALMEAFQLLQEGMPASALADRMIPAIERRMHYLGYAALAGLLLGFVSLVPSAIRSGAERLIFWTIFGAISGAFSIACGAFLYKGYWLYRGGVAADELPIAALLTQEMNLPALLPYGAVVGAVLALAMAVVSLVRDGEAREAAAALANAPMDDPDTMIRAQRAQRAQQYLAERGQRDPSYSQPGHRIRP